MNFRIWFSKEGITHNDYFCFKSPVTKPDRYRLIFLRGNAVKSSQFSNFTPNRIFMYSVEVYIVCFFVFCPMFPIFCCNSLISNMYSFASTCIAYITCINFNLSFVCILSYFAKLIILTLQTLIQSTYLDENISHALHICATRHNYARQHELWLKCTAQKNCCTKKVVFIQEISSNNVR